MLTQVEEVFISAIVHHKSMAEKFHELKEKTQDVKTGMLMDYLSKKHGEIATCFEEYNATCHRDLLKEWIKYYPSTHKREYDSCEKKANEIQEWSFDDVLDFSQCMDQVMINEYDGLNKLNNNKCVNRIFDCLKEKIIQDEKNLSKSILWLNDI